MGGDVLPHLLHVVVAALELSLSTRVVDADQEGLVGA